MDLAHEWAVEWGSTRKIIEHLWPDMEPQKYSRGHFEDLALTFEYVVRRAAELTQLTK